MTGLMIVLRIIHIFSGIFWVGTNFFMILFFVPSVRSAGPAGGAVMGKLVASKFSTTIGIAALLTVLAGLTMYGLDSKGFQIEWIAGPSGIVLTIGAVAGILAAGVGLGMQKPISDRMAAVQKEIAAGGGSPTPEQIKELQSLQVRLARASKIAVFLMIIAVLGMVMAREFGTLD
jgi:uncharacterized membrane protein